MGEDCSQLLIVMNNGEDMQTGSVGSDSVKMAFSYLEPHCLRALF